MTQTEANAIAQRIRDEISDHIVRISLLARLRIAYPTLNWGKRPPAGFTEAIWIAAIAERVTQLGG